MRISASTLLRVQGHINQRTANALVDRGLIKPITRSLTETGLAVMYFIKKERAAALRAHLQEQAS